MLTSFILLVLVLVAGVLSGGDPRPGALQPATATRRIDTARIHTARADRLAASALFALRFDKDDENSIVMDSLRVLGLVRRNIEKPVVGQRAYVRVWERIRALIVLAAIIVTIGVMVAASIGLLVLAAGFLLEQAIA